MTNRPVTKIIEPQLVFEGAGVLLKRSFAPHATNLYDPFLLFDHFAFNDPNDGPLPGFPMHPHRGIETVTYMLEGSVRHGDSLGNSGIIGPGDVQWMTAGGGILHEEMPELSPQGTIYGFQLWVNLPAALKMAAPRYQEIKTAVIPVVQHNGATIRLVAGGLDGVRGPATGIAADPLYAEVSLPAQSKFSLPVNADLTVLVYVFSGEGTFGAEVVSSPSMLLLGSGDLVSATSTSQPLRFMLMAGVPFREPVAPYGPFVMNTRSEIEQALQDLRNGTFVQKGA